MRKFTQHTVLNTEMKLIIANELFPMKKEQKFKEYTSEGMRPFTLNELKETANKLRTLKFPNFFSN